MAKRVNESSCWQYFEKPVSGKAECKFCHKTLACVGGSTSGLMSHVRSAHSEMLKSASSPSQPKLMTFGVGVQRPCPDSRQEKITSLIVDMLVANMLPMALVESDEFRILFAYIEPQYKPPCRQTMTARIDASAAKRRKEMKDELATMTAVAVTTDIWTSIANDPYISLTASYLTPSWELRTPTLANTLMDERHTLPNITMRLAEVSQNKYSFFDKAYSSAKIRVGLLNDPSSIVQLTPKSQITIGLCRGLSNGVLLFLPR